jgi:hypothetical protein
MDEALIMPTNRRSKLCEAYVATLATLYYNLVYYVAFATGLVY